MPMPQNDSTTKGFSTPPAPENWAAAKKFPPPRTEAKRKSTCPFHVANKIPSGDSPYCRAKYVQMVEKDPSRAVPLFWHSINKGDRVESSLKDMAVVMKQLNRSDEAIEAIQTFRGRCNVESQESLDNILLELYKNSGRLDEQIELLHMKLKQMDDGSISYWRKMARSEGKRIQITIGQEYARISGNLAWAYLQKDEYNLAEQFYRISLCHVEDKNRLCNLAICLMYLNKMAEVNFLLKKVKASSGNGGMSGPYVKSYKRAVQVLNILQSDSPEKAPPCFSFLLHTKLAESYREETEFFTQPRCEIKEGPCFGKMFTSPVPIGSTLKMPLTQSRSCSRSLYRKKLSFEQTVQMNWNAEARDGFDNGNYCHVSSDITRSEMGSLATSAVEDIALKATSVGKKSWADIVEEDDQDTHLYDSENKDCNVIDENENVGLKIGSLKLHDHGYYSQRRSKSVKRSLGFNDQKHVLAPLLSAR